MINILIADSYCLTRAGLLSVLANHPELKVVCQSIESNQVSMDISIHQPDVVIMDIHIQPDGSVPIIKAAINNNACCKFLILAGAADDGYIIDVLRAGASGCILRNMDENYLIQSINEVAENKSPISPEIARELLRYLREEKELVYDVSRVSNPLTHRELMVLRLLSEGMQNKIIGLQLDITERTVEAHVRNILKKMHATSRTHAVILASRKGWLETVYLSTTT